MGRTPLLDRLRLGGVDVTFTVVSGDAGFVDPLDPTADLVSFVVEPSDSDGRAAVVLRLGEAGGNSVVEATFSGGSSTATFRATAMRPGNPDNTVVSGVVLDNTDTPMQNVTVKIRGEPTLETLTDSDGQFRLAGVPVGNIILAGR